MKPYPEVDPKPRFPDVERDVLEFWKRERIFEESVEQRPAGEKGENRYVFYDGPPFANGLPHYGHLLTGYVKDIVPRYQTLRGRRVERRFGWDCHGLPAEMEAEKELGISGRTAIEEYGIDRFNQACQTSVLKYTGEWERTVTRQGRWVDFHDDYKTMDLSYMESVIWAFKQLWDKGLVYEDYRVLPYSWAAQTPLSNFETRLDDSFREREDPSVTVRFRLVDGDAAEGPTSLLAWTTTPWTLPSNLATAVGPELDYAIFEKDGERLIIGEAATLRYEPELAEATRVGSVRGSDLAGKRYQPLFPFFADTENAFRVLAADFVNTEEGTGVVHLAPGFGEDDLTICREAGIPVVVPVDEAGAFTSEVSDFAGLNVFEANKPIIRALRDAGQLVKHEMYRHNYPHCWRTDEPLIYKAMTSWYVEVTRLRDRMLELNQQINWIPGHIRDGQFGKWIGNARDWCISRNRFWGTPIPIWRSDDPEHPRTDVYGSIEEIERDFGVKVENLHRPEIDALVRPNPDDPTGKSRMRRIPEVLDCWFDSGSMTYAQSHYPFEQRETFEAHFPADFIVEYVAQTRGWFYTMMILGTALFDRPPFQNCVCHGVVLDTKGRKLSKRLKNYPDPEAMFEKHGSDALRWYLCSSPVLRGLELRVDIEGKGVAEAVRTIVNPLWNAYYFFCLYANADGLRASRQVDSPETLDRYVLAKTRALVEDVAGALDAYDIPGACARVEAYVDALNNWYIRRSRSRFWKSEQDADKQTAYDTLHTVLVTLAQVTSPLLPFLAEEMYKGLTAEKSVHLSDWPDVSDFPRDDDLVRDMDRVRDVCSTALSLRREHDIRVRQPLATLTVAGPGAKRLEPYVALIEDEVNVKQVRLTEAVDEFARHELKVNARAAGPRLGPEMKKVLAAARAGEWTAADDGAVEVAGQRLETSEFSLTLVATSDAPCRGLADGDAVVLLDVTLSDELVLEGHVRDLVRAVQQARKDADLDVSDHIELWLEVPDAIEAGVTRYGLAEATLADRIHFGPPTQSDGLTRADAEIEGAAVRIGLARIS